MTQYFGNANPAAGANRGASADFDGDGSTNLQEYRNGTTPTDPKSVFRATSFTPLLIQWPSRAYDAYELKSSTDLSTWTRVGPPIAPVLTSASRAIAADASLKKLYRVEKVP
jgi:hypothetical protein